jgi:hypothetical protein
LADTVTGKYWPAQIAELENRPSLIGAPVLCEALTNTKALLMRLEDGVTVPRQQQREIVRLLYVATRNQAKALIATLEIDGLE